MGDRPFWESSYQDDAVWTFGIQPNAEITVYEPLFSKNWSVLDAGCGEGKNVLYLAGRGYKYIDAFDISENAVAKVKRLAEKQQLTINAFAEDLRCLDWMKTYDLVMTYGTLHFVSKSDWKTFLRQAKEHTKTGGIHLIQIFTNKVPASEDIRPFAIGLAEEGELKSVYEDWNILSFKSYVFEDEHPGVPKHMHASNKIVARKL